MRRHVRECWSSCRRCPAPQSDAESSERPSGRGHSKVWPTHHCAKGIQALVSRALHPPENLSTRHYLASLYQHGKDTCNGYGENEKNSWRFCANPVQYRNLKQEGGRPGRAERLRKTTLQTGRGRLGSWSYRACSGELLLF